MSADVTRHSDVDRAANGAARLPPSDVERFRAQIQRILDSPGFAGSRRLTDFLNYVSEAAFAGRSELDQYEIAEHVLQRDSDFNPLDDASVRKLASQTRRKLKEHYAAEGASDEIVVTLPRRSYLPRFRAASDAGRAELADGAAESASRPNAGTLERSGWSRWTAAFAALAAIGWAGVFLLLGRSAAPPEAPVEAASPADFTVFTERGDLRGAAFDTAESAIRVGPMAPTVGDVAVRMRFHPNRAFQQAGLALIRDPNWFVRVGRHLKGEIKLEFGAEGGEREQVLFAPDPLGWAEAPTWIKIRRDRERFRAFSSSEGFYWRELSEPLTLAGEPARLRLGVYAFNGRNDSPAVRAEFDRLTMGLAFHDREEGPADLSMFPEWQVGSDCLQPAATEYSSAALRIEMPGSADGCNWSLLSRPPAPEWTLSTYLDFHPASGDSAGLYVAGSKGFLRLVRRDLNGGSIRLERRLDRDSSFADLPGEPPVMLRLSLQDGRLRGSFSRDGESFLTLPEEVELAELGEIQAAGVEASTADWATERRGSHVRFFWVHWEINQLETLHQALSGAPEPAGPVRASVER